ncbi:MAG TPA: dihydrolipoamide acetyltransferase family protein [Labilithrix sp.]|nr:dihydrolipoamide acetyltransferase family protein [Labilithrix sp.]
MADFCMPSLGADMDAGTLIEWRVRPGAHVTRGEVVALVETQKGLIEVEVWETGIVDRLLVQAGAKVPVGSVLATIRGDGPGAAPAPAPAAPAVAAAVAPAPAPLPPLPAAVPAPTSGGPGAHVRASPAARQLAREHDLDLTTVTATGPHGAVTRDDVARAVGAPVAAPPPPPAPPAAPAAPAPRRDVTAAGAAMRKAIAAAMARSKREIPHYYLAQDIEVGRATRWLEERNARAAIEGRVLFAAVLLKATALALREVPELNGHFVDGEHRPSAAIHVGVAIALRPSGLVAPAIRDTDQRSLTELMAALGDVVGRARAGTLRSSEMSDPTITVTNLGDQGVDTVFGVIYPPQVALVGFGTVRERPWAENGLLGVRSVVTATLAADHRVSDGHRGARFLAAIARLLDRPEDLE